MLRNHLIKFKVSKLHRFINTKAKTSFLKPIKSSLDAIKIIKPSSTLLVGGFGLCGIPENLIRAIYQTPEINNLTIVSSNAGMVSSYIGENKEFARMYFDGDVEIEFMPQGTLAEKMRAGGAGIPAFFTRTGFGTQVQKGGIPIKFSKNKQPIFLSSPKEVKVFDGIEYLLEPSITGDFALIKAYKADKSGNVIFRNTAQNFNTAAAKAAKYTIAEVEEVVETGDLNPNEIQLPGIYVDCIVRGEKFDHKIEKIQIMDENTKDTQVASDPIREKIIRRASKEFHNGMYGMPLLAANYIDQNIVVHLQSENGLLGLGPYPTSIEQVDSDTINAGKESVTIAIGGSVFSSEESFGMIRGSHLDMTMLGGMEVSRFGDLANWIIPGKMAKGMGGAMDLVATQKSTKVIVTMTHTTKNGNPKILEECTLPLTGKNCVDRIITEKGVFDVDTKKGLTLVELAYGITIEEIRNKTGCSFDISKDLKETY